MATRETLTAQKNDDSFSHILDELKWRGLVALSTDEKELRSALDKEITYYCGFDPTAPSSPWKFGSAAYDAQVATCRSQSFGIGWWCNWFDW